jgi:glycosyltransferase involved in cell wall biosynthesis
MLPSTELQAKLGLVSDDFVVISVANMVKVKGIETLLEAVKMLNNPKVKVLIVGDDKSEYASELKLRYKHENSIQFLGKQLDVTPYLAGSDLFVIPTKDEGRREGIPNAPLEAMSMERIVLGSNISGVRDILETFPNYMFKADDVSGLEHKIKRIMDMPDTERKSVEIEMRKRVIDVFCIKDFITNHEQLYRKLLHK